MPLGSRNENDKTLATCYNSSLQENSDLGLFSASFHRHHSSQQQRKPLLHSTILLHLTTHTHHHALCQCRYNPRESPKTLHHSRGCPDQHRNLVFGQDSSRQSPVVSGQFHRTFTDTRVEQGRDGYYCLLCLGITVDRCETRLGSSGVSDSLEWGRLRGYETKGGGVVKKKRVIVLCPTGILLLLQNGMMELASWCSL